MHQSIEVDDKIFQDAVKFYGTVFSLPPLASKIYSYLLFDYEKVGITFDEFVEVLAASKSSVSTSISLLLKAQLIVDHNKMDERKRYFFINDEYKKIRFEKIVQKMKDELKLLDDLNNFKKNNDDGYNERIDNYKALLNKNIQNIQESLNKL
ncbi:transcriptional regulator [Chryseobacterium indologenes]|uniref:Transcriptional regulator n=1 Tax=Chryseobacterium indologenes TaxID=253 RepID=A0A1Z3VZU1_CHRID|nr:MULTISPECIES: transcriptional regulator [Chryseobacterium]ASE61046.1 transcriptional regulator [Chryseobacterium indologenes]ATN05127.1 transcriptional regulator [Chryseobacterium indologenes]AYY86121.1 transcriptional regulator [Chryseobacterium indologenes]AYZ35891.1 transcriptional regulator [Chryseobacterium indologenes]AZB16704.1 transcriptional regulator [Chryseobacterium indologenes]